MISKICKVAVDKVNFVLDKPFSYILPKDFEDNAKVGSRVIIPFGRGNSKRKGIILKICDYENEKNLKSIINVIDTKPLVTKEILDLCLFMRDRYFCSVYDCVKAVLPSGLNVSFSESYIISENAAEKEETQNLNPLEKNIYNFIKEEKKPLKDDIILKFGNKSTKAINSLCALELIEIDVSYKKLCNDAKKKMVRLIEEDYFSVVKRSKNYKKIVELLIQNGDMSTKEIEYFSGIGSKSISNLEKTGIVTTYELTVYRNPFNEDKKPNKTDIILSKDQEEIYAKVLDSYNEKPCAFLLNGVTGSGKTQIYLKLIDDVIKEGKEVIVLIPEIALTSQTLNIFYQRYGGEIAVLHSGLSLGERLDQWKRIKEKKVKIAIGTRSCIFAPFENLGLVIMDEEGENTYKSEMTPKYSAKEIASYRSVKNNAMLLLLSATPSLESMYYYKNGRYKGGILNTRYNEKALPKVMVVDMTKEVTAQGFKDVSDVLLQELQNNIDLNHQSILLLNRRGYFTFLKCDDCGEAICCENCSVSLTYHKASNRYVCHICGKSVGENTSCSSCNSKNVKSYGIGTQKAQEYLEKNLKGAKILRMDADTTLGKNTHDKMFKSFNDKKYNILLGTQMVAKGLDFSDVTLVGILGADQNLFSSDFKAREKSFSLLTQVIGRAGRGSKEGKAIIQTFCPENEIIELARNQDYEKFYDEEIEIRKAMMYPPFCDICQFVFTSLNQNEAKGSGEIFYLYLQNAFTKFLSNEKYTLYNLSKLSVFKMNNKYRYKIILKCKMKKEIRSIIKMCLIEFSKRKNFKKANVQVDINPININ